MSKIGQWIICAVWLFLSTACGNPGGFASVPALDNSGVRLRDAHGTLLSLSELEQRLADFRGDRLERDLFGHPSVILRYAVRSVGGMYAPAALLRITFDRNGVVTDWHFVNPVSGAKLEIVETLEHAVANVTCVQEGANVQTDLGKSIRIGQSTQSEIDALLSIYQPPRYRGVGTISLPWVEKSAVAGGEQWDYNVDRPSPLFIPPSYLIIEFAKDDTGPGKGRAYLDETSVCDWGIEAL